MLLSATTPDALAPTVLGGGTRRLDAHTYDRTTFHMALLIHWRASRAGDRRADTNDTQLPVRPRQIQERHFIVNVTPCGLPRGNKGNRCQCNHTNPRSVRRIPLPPHTPHFPPPPLLGYFHLPSWPPSLLASVKLLTLHAVPQFLPKAYTNNPRNLRPKHSYLGPVKLK